MYMTPWWSSGSSANSRLTENVLVCEAAPLVLVLGPQPRRLLGWFAAADLSPNAPVQETTRECASGLARQRPTDTLDTLWSLQVRSPECCTNLRDLSPHG